MDEGASITAMTAVIAPLRGAAAAAVAWCTNGRLHLTVIAKATFAFMADAPASLTEPQAIVRAEVYAGNDPRRSPQLTSDLSAYLPRADVLFTGSAYAPGGVSVRALPVRLAIFSGQRPVIDKRLLAQDASGFLRMPVIYERAPCGVGGIENPFGVVPGQGEPGIIDPAKPDRMAGLGPIGRGWPLRKRLLGATPRRAIEAPIAEIPADFDWSYFNAAPLDQRTDFLRGNEWILLEGLHPSLPRFRTCLPGARGRARVHGLSAFGVAEGATLELVADTLFIDGDAQLCTVVWRRSFPLSSEAALAAVRVVAGVEVAGEAIVWPEPPLRAPPRAPAASPRAPAASPAAPPAGTLALSPEEQTLAAADPALPFARKAGAEPRQSPPGAIPGAPWSNEVAPPIPAVPAMGAGAMTLSLNDETTQHSPWATGWFAPKESPLEEAERRFRVLERARATAPDETAPQETVPYFDPTALAAAVVPAMETPAAPEAPPPEPSDFPLERVAAITAALAEARRPEAQPGHRPPAEILRAHDLTEAAWGAIVHHWTNAIQNERTRGPGRLQAAYDAAYVAAVEGFRGPITPEEYARLVVAMERKESERVLDELRIQRPARMHVIRLWTKKVATDPVLFKGAQAALAVLRGQ